MLPPVLLLLAGVCESEVCSGRVCASVPSAAFAPPALATPTPSAKRQGLIVFRAHARCGDAERAADAALERWADQSGVERAVKIGRGKFGRGLFATRDLAAGDVALRVPLSLRLSDHEMLPSLAQQAGLLAVDSSVIHQLDHSTRLALNLSCEVIAQFVIASLLVYYPHEVLTLFFATSHAETFETSNLLS